MQLSWKPCLSVSALHTAESCWQHSERIHDDEVLSIMRSHADRLGRWIAALPTEDTAAFWNTLILTASIIDSNRELASDAILECGIQDESGVRASQLSELITDVEAAFRQLFPRYTEQSSFRFRPLQEQWLGYGRGLMAQVNRNMRCDPRIHACTVLGMQPILGGFGKAHPDRGVVRIEAVLTNSRPELPEVIRLGWLITQLLGEVSEDFTMEYPSSINALLPFATIPPILAAGQELELSRCDSATIALAIEHWHIGNPLKPLRGRRSLLETKTPDEMAEKLLQWWQARDRSESDWRSSLQMLANHAF